MTIFVYAPDLMDRSKITAAADVVIVRRPADLAATEGDTVVVDLSRPGVLDALPRLTGARVIGFGSHVDRATLDAARNAGCDEVMARSAFFGGLPDLLT